MKKKKIYYFNIMSSSENNPSNNMDSSNNGVKPIKWEIPDVENQNQKQLTSPPVYVNSEPKDDKCKFCKCMLACFGLTLILGILFGMLVLYGFNIYSLTLISNKTIHNRCEDSHIWEWMISFMAISLAMGMGSNKKTDDGGAMQFILNNLCQLIIMTGMTCWGCYEIWGVDCVDKTLLLYTLSQVTVGFYITILGIFLIGICIGCCAMITESKCAKRSLNNM